MPHKQQASAAERELESNWCPSSMRETEWVLPGEQLCDYLRWIAEHFAAGMGNSEIASAVRLANDLDYGGAAELCCAVTLGEAVVSLKVHIQGHDSGSLVVSLCTEPQLSEQLDWTVERFYDHMAE